ncbi:MAG: LLM class flavin-dependent oxidoreductase [Pseudomonadales bacterium]|nr:LLM class flavin-dependent oxidoreductase [Pseudomonadales bacterium]
MPEQRLRLGVLDQSPVPSGSTHADALRTTLELARITERLGYHRYWVAEHHGSESFAGSSPEILIGQIAAVTSRIRVGSAGVMLMHYSPLKVAENFKVLAALHPGRIDLGVGRAPGSDGLTAAALAYGSQIGIEYFPAKLGDLQAFLADRPPYTEAFARVVATPRVDIAPELWMLGSSEDGARLAAHFGLPFSYAHFIGPDAFERACGIYRDAFRPSATLAEPYLNVGLFALCTEDRREAERLARCRDVWRLRVERGEFGPIPSIEEAEAVELTAAEETRIAERRQHQILGTRDEVADQITALARRVGAAEVAVISITHAFAARVRCYELLAEAFLQSKSP